ncbi:hypothetical protein PISMIDRAFT_689398, partial [Pisolithus microcarpus 441]
MYWPSQKMYPAHVSMPSTLHSVQPKSRLPPYPHTRPSPQISTSSPNPARKTKVSCVQVRVWIQCSLYMAV